MEKAMFRILLKRILAVVTCIPLIFMCCYGITVKIHPVLLKMRLGNVAADAIPVDRILEAVQGNGIIEDSDGTAVAFVLKNDDENNGLGSTNWKDYYGDGKDVISNLLFFEKGVHFSEITSSRNKEEILGYKIYFTASNLSSDYKCAVHIIVPADAKKTESESIAKAVWWNVAFNYDYYKLRNMI